MTTPKVRLDLDHVNIPSVLFIFILGLIKTFENFYKKKTMKFFSVLIFSHMSFSKHVTRGPPTTPEEHPCKDHELDCIAWAHHGECESNPGYMLEHCAYSCGVCKAGIRGHLCIFEPSWFKSFSILRQGA